ncbi:hypothetical protein LWC34_40335 [Kibdelosporangium philippinense]|uniref:PASTA domain-containing protein n=1 Tax=Kibdelosporangium philippinense TaxID=211113 RepID=A0ABS8ZMT5_9PSEU|nr:hypothetical protein [Kibdelosporangium philippinense]MCE7009020.1 hypothetical protein [Kibdelosporangium philippinense]
MGAKWRLATVTALLALATACGSSDSGGDKVASLGGDKQGNAQGNENAANDGKTDEDRMRDFAKCMREHGIDMPDPGPDGSMSATRMTEGDAEKWSKAGEACNKLLPNGGKPKPLSPEELDKARAKAKCMREHGFNWPDPNPDGSVSGGTIDLSGDKEKTEKAFKECGVETMGVPAAGGGR